MQNLIYALVDPHTLLVRYIGLSSTGMKRPRDHRNPSQLKSRTHKTNWIRSLQALGLDYTIVVLEEVASSCAVSVAEIWWIAYGRASGWPLTNLTDGGEGVTGHKPSAETRAKMSAARRGKKRSPEACAKSAATQRGRKLGPRSPEATAKAAASNRGRKRTPEARAKMAAAMKGKRRSPEQRASQSARQSGKAFFTGKKHSPETKAKMRLAWEKRRRRAVGVVGS